MWGNTRLPTSLQLSRHAAEVIAFWKDYCVFNWVEIVQWSFQAPRVLDCKRILRVFRGFRMSRKSFQVSIRGYQSQQDAAVTNLGNGCWRCLCDMLDHTKNVDLVITADACICTFQHTLSNQDIRCKVLILLYSVCLIIIDYYWLFSQATDFTSLFSCRPRDSNPGLFSLS